MIMAWSPGQIGQPIAPGSPLYGHPVSPDGRRMVIDAQHTDPEPYPEVALLNLNDGSIEPIHLLGQPRRVHWSPDGHYLLYTDWQEGDDQLILYNVASADNTPIANVSDIYYTAGWSADGGQIAFVANADGRYDLYVLDVNSWAVQRLTNTPEVEIAAVWSPVDRTLLVGSTPYDENVMREGYLTNVTTLHLIDSDGRSCLLGNFEDVHSGTLAWATDGQRIAYADKDTLNILELVTNDTICPKGDARPLGSFLMEEQPAWSPDDQWLAFRATGFKDNLCFGVYALELATGEVSTVEEGSCTTGSLYWVADQKSATH
jgi:Tol biopolymer transport system component